MVRVFGAALVAAAVIAGIVVGVYEPGWWLRADATNRQAQVNQSRLDELHQDLTMIAGIGSWIAATTDPNQQAALRAQGHGLAASVCDAASQMSALPIDLASFVSKNCTDGTVGAFSQYAY